MNLKNEEIKLKYMQYNKRPKMLTDSSQGTRNFKHGDKFATNNYQI